MPLDSDLERIKAELRDALGHPLRVRILEAAADNRGEPLSVEELTDILKTTPGFEHTTADKVNYHYARLQDAELIPTG